MSNNCKVSIIMPVYNGEKYLKECLECVLHQSLKDIQIICIDDGSADDSLCILQKYAAMDKRVVILEAGHEGAAVARNIGMKHATGEYICFLDCDDIFELDMLEEMYMSADKHQAEITFCEFDTDISGKKRRIREYLQKRYMERYSKQLFSMKELPVNGFLLWGIAPWTKLYKREFLQKTGLQFQPIKNANDVYFSVMSMIYAEKMIHTDSFKAMVHYRTNNVQQISSNRKVINIYLAIEKIFEEMKRCVTERKLYEQYYVMALIKIIQELACPTEEERDKKEFYDFFSQEGIEKLGLNQLSKNEELLGYNELLESFRNCTYESKWFRKKLLAGIQLDIKGYQEIEKICANNRVALWGLGVRGYTILENFIGNDIKLAGVVDGSSKIIGTSVLGYNVKAFEEIQDEIDIIIITSTVACDSICNDIQKKAKKRLKVLPLFMYLESDLKLEECIFQVDELFQIDNE